MTDQAAYHLKKTVVLVGMMGSGKTAIGRQLAQVVDVPFVDSDAEIEVAANASISEVFERDGEAFFRDREAEVIARLMRGAPCILSTGGGAFLAERNRDVIAKEGVALWLHADLDLLWERVRHKNTRPLLRTADPFATLKKLLQERVDVYALADLKIKCQPAYSIDQTVDQVLQVLLTVPEILEAA